MKTTIAASLSLLLLVTSCIQPGGGTTSLVENHTRYDARMFLYKSGQLYNFFRVEAETREVILYESGFTLGFRFWNYDSIRISFDNGRTHLFLNDTIHQYNDIFNPLNWVEVRGDRRYDYSLIYILTREMLK